MKLLCAAAVYALVSLVTAAPPAQSWTRDLPPQRRAVEDADSQDVAAPKPPSVYPLGPLNPFLSLKPFFPAKPTFMPPFVDPQFFIDKKAEMLNTLFSSKALAGPSASKRALADPVSPWAALAAPTPKPTIVPPSFWIPFPAAPLSPFAPPAPIDPSVFIDKKMAFLNKLFTSLNTPTPAPLAEQEPKSVTGSGIVPADFWYTPPADDPATMYTEKVSEFLDKLFSTLATSSSDNLLGEAAVLATLKRDLGVEEETAKGCKTDAGCAMKRAAILTRSVAADDSATSLTAKDKIIGSIVAELGGLKDSMLDTIDELAKAQKVAATAAAASSKTAPGKKPKAFVSPYAAMWATTPKPTEDPTAPLKKKIELLDQVFNMLTQLQKDVTVAMNEAEGQTAVASPVTPPTQNQSSIYAEIKSKIAQLVNSTKSKPAPSDSAKFVRAMKPLPPVAPTIVDPTFWIPPAVAVPPGPGFYVDKTQQFLNKLFDSLATGALADGSDPTSAVERSIKMAVHQGYQSLPPGAEETLQAGGGSSPDEHEGGGLTLQVRHLHQDRDNADSE